MAAHYCRNVDLELPTLKVTTKGKGGRQPSPRLKTLGAANDGTEWVTCIAFSPAQHTQVVSGSSQGRIRVWDVESGELVYVPTTTHSRDIHSVVFSPDGSWVVSGSWDCTVRAWHIKDNTSTVIAIHQSHVFTVAISSDSAMIVSASADGAIQVCDFLGNTVTVSKGPYHPSTLVWTMAFRPSADMNVKWLVTSWADGLLHVWNVASGEMKTLAQLDKKSFIQILAFTPDGTRLICGSTIGIISVRDPDSGSIIHEFRGHEDSVCSLSVSPSGKYYVSSSVDKLVKIWALESGGLACEPFVEDGLIGYVAWSQDNYHIVCGSNLGTITVYDATILDSLRTWDSSMLSDVVAGGGPQGAAVLARDGSWIATGTRSVVKIWKKDPDGQWGISDAWDSGHTEDIWPMEISYDQQLLVTGSADGTARVWKVNDETKEPVVLRVESRVRAVVFPPVEGSSWVATGSLGGGVKIWDVYSGNLLHNLQASPENPRANSVTSLAFGPDGRKIASGSFDGVVRIWDIDANSIEITVDAQLNDRDPIASVAFSNDGRIAAGCRDSGVFNVWDATSGAHLLGPLRGHEEQLYSISFHPTANFIATTSWTTDGLIRLWDSEAGEPISSSRRGHTSRVKKATFSSDGDWLLSSSEDGVVRIWDAKKLTSVAPVLHTDGWLVGEKGELLLWIPAHLRHTLLWEDAQIAVFGTGFSTKVELSNFKDDDWYKSFQPS